MRGGSRGQACLQWALLLWLLGSDAPQTWGQWPTYQQNTRRTGAARIAIDWQKLEYRWRWQSNEPPRPAWAGPAMWDAYANIRDLPAMRDYDSVPHAILVDGRVYFGSTTDDTLRCLSATTGELIWSFTADGPVRLSPTWSDDRVFFGSDDGAAYCVDANDGELVWRVTAAPNEASQDQPLLINNGRLIARHPIRTGVLVNNGLAYFGAALLPWEPGYLCAVDAETGLLDIEGGYRKQLDGKTLEGSPAMTQSQLVFPQGRVAPQLFRRSDGQDLGALKDSSGGSIVVIDQGQVMHGPGAESRRGAIAASDVTTGERIAAFGRGNAMVVDRGVVYMLANNHLTAASLKTRQPLWKTPVDSGLSLIKAGSALVVGGVDLVVAFDVESGRELWRQATRGRVKGLAAGDGTLLASTDEGLLVCFSDQRQATRNPKAPPAPNDTNALPQNNTPLTALPPLEPQGLLGEWFFRRDQTEGRSVANRALQDEAAPGGNPAAEIQGPFRWSRSGDGRDEAIQWDGGGSAVVAADHRQAKLPERTLTVEALVRVDRPTTWGGIASVIQDNGAFERGWLLGFRDDKFCFGLCSRQGDAKGKLTYLTAPQSFTPGQWAHLAGSYDGETMRLFVDGRQVAVSHEQSGDIWYPPRTIFELNAYHDDNEHYRTQGSLHHVRLFDRVLTPAQVSAHASWATKVARHLALGTNPDAPSPRSPLASGPVLRFLDDSTAEVSWETRQPVSTELQWWLDAPGGERSQWSAVSQSQGTNHRVLLGPLRVNRRYPYRIVLSGDDQDSRQVTPEFVCDTFFNYSPAFPHRPSQIRDGGDGKADESVDLSATWFAEQTDAQGLCLVIGADLAEDAERLATSYRVLVVDADERKIQRLRSHWLASGKYGSCLTVASLTKLQSIGAMPGDWANLIVTQQRCDTRDSLRRLSAAPLAQQLKPGGGVLLELIAEPSSPTAADNPGDKFWSAPPQAVVGPDGRRWLRGRRAKWPRTGDWRHLYGAADNAAYTGEALADAKSANDFVVQWIGRPGPRYQSDRSGRKPSPLAAAGRLYLQGWRRIVTLDVHNGEPLWSLELPHFERFNVPRDCGNWCADERHVYAALQDRLWQIDGATGDIVRKLRLPEDFAQPIDTADAFQWNWGFVGRSGEQLLGTAVRSDAVWTNFWGGAESGWYDAKSGEVTAHVAGDALFAYDSPKDSADAPRIRWVYRGLVLHSTITAAKNRIWFLECRDEALKSTSTRRIQGQQAWRQMALVCLDAKTGKRLWERRLDAEPGKVMVSLAHSRDRLVLLTSSDGKFHIRAFRDDGQGGDAEATASTAMAPTKAIWEQHVPWGRDNHGGHMSRPAIVNDTVYVRPFSFSLRDGQRLPQRMPVGGCGTYACTDAALFFRQSTVTVWDRDTANTTQWQRLRPDCWLSTIPADGMLLSPEGGGGCSCGTWLETSLGFKPRRK